MSRIKELLEKKKIRYRRFSEDVESLSLFSLTPEELARAHPNDLANLLEDLPISKQIQIFSRLDDYQAAQVLSHIEDEHQLNVARAFGIEHLTQLLEKMPSDQVADLISRFTPEKMDSLLKLMAEDVRNETIELLSYAEDTAGGVMAKELIDFLPSETVRQAIQTLRKEFDPQDFIDYLYVTDSSRKLVGVVSLKELILSPTDALLSEVMQTNLVSVNLNDDQEKIAYLATRYNLKAVPVLDNRDRLVGIVTPEDIAEIIKEEYEEDLLHMAGLNEDGDSSESHPVKAALYRYPWLFLTMIAGLVASSIVATNLNPADVWLLSFTTLICGMAGNVAVQSSTVIVRKIAAGQFEKQLTLASLGREFLTGLSLALLCGVTVGSVIGLIKGPAIHGLVVGASVCCVIVLAVGLSVLIPFFMYRLGVDPAISSGPLLTMLTDVLGLSIYFQTAFVLIHWLGS